MEMLILPTHIFKLWEKVPRIILEHFENHIVNLPYAIGQHKSRSACWSEESYNNDKQL